MEEKKKRPAIPENVKRELWIKSGGRCEFRGCNKYLYKDGVTKQPRNLANIAHIVSWTPTGPRGNQNSEKLATDISNLMLTCLTNWRSFRTITTLKRSAGMYRFRMISYQRAIRSTWYRKRLRA